MVGRERETKGEYKGSGGERLNRNSDIQTYSECVCLSRQTVRAK